MSNANPRDTVAGETAAQPTVEAERPLSLLLTRRDHIHVRLRLRRSLLNWAFGAVSMSVTAR